MFNELVNPNLPNGLREGWMRFNCSGTPTSGNSIRLTAALPYFDRPVNVYLENGNIKNSVNYPACSMGVCRSESRIAIFHENKVNMINRLTTLIGGSEVNIAEMTSKSRGEVEYTMMDLDAPATKELVDQISRIEGVWRVRVIK